MGSQVLGDISEFTVSPAGILSAAEPVSGNISNLFAVADGFVGGSPAPAKLTGIAQSGSFLYLAVVPQAGATISASSSTAAPPGLVVVNVAANGSCTQVNGVAVADFDNDNNTAGFGAFDGLGGVATGPDPSVSGTQDVFIVDTSSSGTHASSVECYTVSSAETITATASAHNFGLSTSNITIAGIGGQQVLVASALDNTSGAASLFGFSVGSNGSLSTAATSPELSIGSNSDRGSGLSVGHSGGGSADGTVGIENVTTSSGESSGNLLTFTVDSTGNLTVGLASTLNPNGTTLPPLIDSVTLTNTAELGLFAILATHDTTSNVIAESISNSSGHPFLEIGLSAVASTAVANPAESSAVFVLTAGSSTQFVLVDTADTTPGLPDANNLNSFRFTAFQPENAANLLSVSTANAGASGAVVGPLPVLTTGAVQ